jgi:hypothetical protein
MITHQYLSVRTVSGNLALRGTAEPGTSRSLLSVAPAAWTRAYQFSLANATIFVVLSWTLLVVEPNSLSATLSAPALFFAGALISFLFLIRSGGAFAALAWFILGAGVYFGLGVCVGGLVPDPRSIHYGSEALLLGDLRRIDVLNSSSVTLVLAAGMPFAYRLRKVTRRRAIGAPAMDVLLLRLFPAISLMALVAIGLQLIFFPIATNLIVRTLLSSIYMIVPCCILALGMVRSRLDFHWAAIGVLVFISALLLSILTMSKFAIMSNVAAFFAGMWVYRRSIWSVSCGLLLMGGFYTYAGALANDGRSNAAYDPVANSLFTRLWILADTIGANTKDEQPQASDSAADLNVPSTVTRFSVADLQAYLMEQYDNHQPGASLDDYWVAAVPRILWPDKPNVTRFGTELHEQFWSTANATSALAPTYSAEAYWNYGPLGVVVVSLLVGMEIGWLTHRWHVAAEGLDPAFVVIAFPTALSASYVETWIAATYVGGFLTIVLVWWFSRFLLLTLFVGAAQKVRFAQEGWDA